MRVSVITSCFNRAETIRDAIESVLCQTYPDIEYIVVDGGSTDGSRDIIESYRNRISKIVFKPDHGMYEGINNGIREATGDVIVLCHSDDQLNDCHTIDRVVQEFYSHPQVDMIYADGLFVNEKGRAVRVWRGKKYRQWRVRCGWLPLHTTCYIRKEVHERFGLYDESYRIAADTKFLMSVLYHHKINAAYLPQMVVKMRMGGSSTSKKTQLLMWKEDVRVFHELGIHPAFLMKPMKMMWKISQFVKGVFYHVVSAK